jgi:hypothetical protein
VFGDPFPTEFARIQVLANRILTKPAHGVKLNGFFVDFPAGVILASEQRHSYLSAFVSAIVGFIICRFSGKGQPPQWPVAEKSFVCSPSITVGVLEQTRQ